MKRLLFLLLASLLLAACSDDVEDVEAEEQGTDEKIEVEISIVPNVQDDGKLIIEGETNIPDGGELMIGIGNEEADYQASSKAIISDGIFESETYSKNGESLPGGEYSVSVTLSLASTQSDDFVDKAGEDYENLTGDLVNDGDMGRTVIYETTFDIESDGQDDKEATYRNELGKLSEELSNHLHDFGALSQEMGENSLLLGDQDFIIKYVTKITSIDLTLDEIEKLEASENLTDAHDEVLKAVKEYRSIRQDLPEALDNMDIDTIERVGKDMEKGNEHIKKATEMISNN